MNVYKIVVEYDGSHYSGWQRQPKQKTVQGEIEKAIKKLFDEQVVIHGSGRTDGGVHAYGQVASFMTHYYLPAEKVTYVLNNFLPDDIRIIETEEKNSDFHARYSAIGKEYVYKIYTGDDHLAFKTKYYHILDKPLDLNLIKEAMTYFLGTHDFQAFKSAGSKVMRTERTILEFDLDVRDEQLIFSIHGNGFLYNMVRIIIGTLIKVGLGEIKPTDIPELLKMKDRSKTRYTAPAEGLYLNKVYYK